MKKNKKELTPYALRNLAHLISKSGSQQSFAEEINVSPTTITRIFDENEISPKTISNICSVHRISEDEFFKTNLYQEQDITKIFDKRYYAYFYALEDLELIDRANIDIKEDSIDFTIVLENSGREKKFTGELNIDDNFFCFNFTSLNLNKKIHGYIMMPRPNIGSDQKYYGGLGFICLPIYRDVYPRVGKVFLTNTRLKLTSIDDPDFKFLMDKLKMDNKNLFTISLDEDLVAGRYITEKIHADVYFE
jgi:hypothetical protein